MKKFWLALCFVLILFSSGCINQAPVRDEKLFACSVDGDCVPKKGVVFGNSCFSGCVNKNEGELCPEAETDGSEWDIDLSSMDCECINFTCENRQPEFEVVPVGFVESGSFALFDLPFLSESFSRENISFFRQLTDGSLEELNTKCGCFRECKNLELMDVCLPLVSVEQNGDRSTISWTQEECVLSDALCGSFEFIKTERKLVEPGVYFVEACNSETSVCSRSRFRIYSVYSWIDAPEKTRRGEKAVFSISNFSEGEISFKSEDFKLLSVGEENWVEIAALSDCSCDECISGDFLLPSSETINFSFEFDEFGRCAGVELEDGSYRIFAMDSLKEKIFVSRVFEFGGMVGKYSDSLYCEKDSDCLLLSGSCCGKIVNYLNKKSNDFGSTCNFDCSTISEPKCVSSQCTVFGDLLESVLVIFPESISGGKENKFEIWNNSGKSIFYVAKRACNLGYFKLVKLEQGEWEPVKDADWNCDNFEYESLELKPGEKLTGLVELPETGRFKLEFGFFDEQFNGTTKEFYSMIETVYSPSFTVK